MSVETPRGLFERPFAIPPAVEPTADRGGTAALLMVVAFGTVDGEDGGIVVRNCRHLRLC